MKRRRDEGATRWGCRSRKAGCDSMFRRDATGACTYGRGVRWLLRMSVSAREGLVHRRIKEQKFYTDAESRVVRSRASGKVPPCGGNFSVARRVKGLGIELHFQGSLRARVRVGAVRENGISGGSVRGVRCDDRLWQCRGCGIGCTFCRAEREAKKPPTGPRNGPFGYVLTQNRPKNRISA